MTHPSQLLGTLLDGLTNVDKRRKENRGKKKSARYGPRCGFLREDWEDDVFSLLRSRADEFDVAGELNPFVNYDDDFGASEGGDDHDDDDEDATEDAEEFECEYGCGFDGTQEEVEEHERTSCALRPSTLAACSVVAKGQGGGGGGGSSRVSSDESEVGSDGSDGDGGGSDGGGSSGSSKEKKKKKKKKKEKKEKKEKSNNNNNSNRGNGHDSDSDYEQRRGAPTEWSHLEPWERLLAIHAIMLWSVESNMTALGKELRKRIRTEGAIYIRALRPSLPRAGHITESADDDDDEEEDLSGVYFILTDEAGGLRVISSPGEEAEAEQAWRGEGVNGGGGGRGDGSGDSSSSSSSSSSSRDRGSSKGRGSSSSSSSSSSSRGNAKGKSKAKATKGTEKANGKAQSKAAPTPSDDTLLRAASAPPLQERRRLRCAGWKLLAATIDETTALADTIEGGAGSSKSEGKGKKRKRKRKRSEAEQAQREQLVATLRARVAEAVAAIETAAAAAKKLVKVRRALGGIGGGGLGDLAVGKRSRRARKKVDYSMSAFDDQILDAVKQLNGSEERAADRAERAYRARRREETEVQERERSREESRQRRSRLGLR